MGIYDAINIERVHTLYCKRILRVKRSTQNDFVYGILGRYNLASIIRYWLKVLISNENKYTKIIYNMLKADADIYPNKTSRATLVRDLLSSMGFYEVWLA